MTVSTLEKETLTAEEYNRSLVIDDKHWQEWIDSGVSPEIILNNVATVWDARVVNRLLNRRNYESKWKTKNDLVPAWYASGVDPLTGMPTHQGLQLKANNPRLDENNKPVKYESVNGMDGAPLFLSNGNPDYWVNVINNNSVPVLITEGAKKAGSGLTIGHPTISLPGVSSCRKLDRLHDKLELFCTPGRVFHLCFDNDILTKTPVRKALVRLSGLLLSYPIGNVMVIQLPPGEAKGMDDYIALHGADAFNELLKSAITFKEWYQEIKEDATEKEEIKLCKLARRDEIIRNHWGQYLRYNTLKKRVELFGRELDEDEVRWRIAKECNEDIPISDAQIITKMIALDDSYSPVVEYLEECEVKYPSPDINMFDHLAYEFFGTNDPDHALYFKNFVVAAVARAFNPGCWVDSVFVLYSSTQGRYKSKFLSTLFGSQFFSDQLKGDLTARDNQMMISSYWGHELSELDKFRRQNTDGDIKTFITAPTDTFRAPYDRREKEHPRTCVFAATTNRQESLQDPTGARRFNICPVLTKIPLDKVREIRDQIWAAAIALYRSGYKYFLSEDAEARNEEKNKNYTLSTVWDDIILNLIESRMNPRYLATSWILEALQIEPGQVRGPINGEITACMTRLGWRKTAKPQKIDGKTTRQCWEKIDNSENIFERNSGVTGEKSVTALIHKDSSGYTSVTPGYVSPSGVTEENLESVTLSQNVTGCNQGVTEYDHLKPLHSAAVTFSSSVTPVFSENKNLEINKQQGTTDAAVTPEYFPPEANAELLRLALSAKDWPQIEELGKYWADNFGQEYRQQVWDTLTPKEREAIRNLKPGNTPKVEGIPVFETGNIIWCNGKLLKITAIKPGNKLEGYFAGEIELSVVSFDDVSACSQSKLFEVKVKDKVKSLVGKDKGKVFTASTLEGNIVWCKGAGRGATPKSFYPHQIQVLQPTQEFKIGDRVKVASATEAPPEKLYLVANVGTIVAEIATGIFKISFDATNNFEAHSQELAAKHLVKI